LGLALSYRAAISESHFVFIAFGKKQDINGVSKGFKGKQKSKPESPNV